MIKCKKCSHEISEKAKACPSCGHPNKTGTSFFTWFIAAIGALFVFTAISGPSDRPRPQTKETTTTQTSSQMGTLIPRSADDGAKYYLISKEDLQNGLIETVSSRVSKQSTGYTRLLINCADLTFKQLGYSDVSIADVGQSSSNPFSEIVSGSSKSDLVLFVCQKGHKP